LKVHLRKRKLRTGRVTLYLEYYHKGSRRLENLRLYLDNTSKQKDQDRRTLQLAEKKRNKIQHEIDSGRHGFKNPSYSDMTLEEWILTLYQNKSGDHRTIIRQLNAYQGASPLLSSVDQEFVNGFRDFLIKDAKKTTPKNPNIKLTKLSANTSFHYMTNLGTVLRKAFNRRLIQEMPEIKGVQHPGSKKIFLTAEEVRQLVNTPSDKPLIKQAFLFSVFTGLRVSEIKALTWDNINDDVLELTTKKTKTAVKIHLSKNALKYLPEKKFHQVFLGFNNTWTAVRDLRRWAESAGIKKPLVYHSGRHSYAMLQLAAGASLKEVQELLGHRDIKNTLVYAQLYESDLKKAGQRKLI